MTTYYTKRAFELLREESFFELSKRLVKLYNKSTIFIFRQLLKPLDPQYYHRFKFHTWKNHLHSRIKYDAPPDPYKTIQIRPRSIEYRAGYTSDYVSLRPIKYKGLAQVEGGEWDSQSQLQHVEEQFNINGIIQRFGQGKDWQDTEVYQTRLTKWSDDERYKHWGYENIEDCLYDIFSRYDNLYEIIRQNGYKVGHKGTNTVHTGSQPVRSRLEVLIVIDRNGEILFFEGQKRFGIARVLDLEIPAHVVCRHKQWQELRDDIYNNGLPKGHEDLRDHPDLQDIINK